MKEALAIDKTISRGASAFIANFFLCFRVVLFSVLAYAAVGLAVLLVMWTVTGLIRSHNKAELAAYIILGVGSGVMLILLPFVHAGWVHVSTKLIHRQHASISDVREGFRHGRAPLWIGIFFFLLFIASAITAFILLPLLVWSALFAYAEITEGRTRSAATAIRRALHAAKSQPVRLGLLTFLSWLIYHILSMGLYIIPVGIYWKVINHPMRRPDFLMFQSLWGVLSSCVYLISMLMVVASFDQAREYAGEPSENHEDRIAGTGGCP